MKSSVIVGAVTGFVIAVATREPRMPTLKKQEPAVASAGVGMTAAAGGIAAAATSSTTMAGTDSEPGFSAPFFGNEKCPVDGNVVHLERYLSFDGQRIYACSQRCLDSLARDPEKSVRSAYAETSPLPTRGCAVCSVRFQEESSEPARPITFQGRALTLCSAGCESELRAHPAAWLTRATWRDVKDANNGACPVDGRAIDGVTVVVWRSTLIRLCGPGCIAAVEQAPDATLARLRGGS